MTLTQISTEASPSAGHHSGLVGCGTLLKVVTHISHKEHSLDDGHLAGGSVFSSEQASIPADVKVVILLLIGS